MKYYSTNKQAPLASLEEAVVKGLAGDKGLYMPEHIRPLDKDTISGLKNKSFHEIACTAAQAFFGEDIEPETLDATSGTRCRSRRRSSLYATISTASNYSTARLWLSRT